MLHICLLRKHLSNSQYRSQYVICSSEGTVSPGSQVCCSNSSTTFTTAYILGGSNGGSSTHMTLTWGCGGCQGNTGNQFAISVNGNCNVPQKDASCYACIANSNTFTTQTFYVQVSGTYIPPATTYVVCCYLFISVIMFFCVCRTSGGNNSNNNGDNGSDILIGAVVIVGLVLCCLLIYKFCFGGKKEENQPLVDK
jgi:hypothetical protein